MSRRELPGHLDGGLLGYLDGVLPEHLVGVLSGHLSPGWGFAPAPGWYLILPSGTSFDVVSPHPPVQACARANAQAKAKVFDGNSYPSWEYPSIVNH